MVDILGPQVSHLDGGLLVDCCLQRPLWLVARAVTPRRLPGGGLAAPPAGGHRRAQRPGGERLVRRHGDARRFGRPGRFGSCRQGMSWNDPE